MTAAPAVTPESIDIRYTLAHLLRKDSKPYELLKKMRAASTSGKRASAFASTAIVVVVRIQNIRSSP